ncbi:unnamed protein product [Strongylus vulgaris]|uniref:Uncharacterized protein n=1 Tax=Strongylus vulgaris TaxID=40348 RepID=A0A3P7K2N9_STRVU|nr:unnamed protein product [Strongylus vulgaris]
MGARTVCAKLRSRIWWRVIHPFKGWLCRLQYCRRCVSSEASRCCS